VRFGIAIALFAFTALVRADVAIVTKHQPVATIVVPDGAPAVVRYAAQEFAYHVERATGAKLPIISETAAAGDHQPHVYLGDTAAARAAGIGHPAPETFTLKCDRSGLIIAGGDKPGDPLKPETCGGTLFGVYEWLERELGVRWLWPGELGTYVPPRASLRARDLDATISPAFFQRNIRGGLTFKGNHPDLDFTPDAAAAYAHEQAVFLRRHRVGKSIPLTYHHAFTDWWKKYGAEHPEWFQLVNGKRGPTRPGGSYSMCVSNPEFRHQLLTQWQQQRGKSANPHVLNAVENGIMGLCECDQCRAWDGPTPEGFLKYYPPKSKVMGSPFVTDRYVKYWLDVERQAEAIDPDVTVVVYNYFNYFAPPTPGTKLNRHILVGSYPSAGWFPRAPDEQAWFKQQWTEWQQTGARLFSRGNYCLDGYAMPLIFPHQFADEFHHQAQHGMEATDYDAITGQWAAQGTNLYLLARLETRPTASTDEILAEYYSAFGGAAPEIKAYFDYWEQYALAHRELINAQYADNTSRWRAFGVAAHVIFPPEAFAAAEKILVAARAAVAADPESARRVEFLQDGLTHARLCADASRELTVRDPASTPERGRHALAELIAFRRAHEREWIANFNYCGWSEDAAWRLPAAVSNVSVGRDVPDVHGLTDVQTSPTGTSGTTFTSSAR
jgi:hypothetical protein